MFDKVLTISMQIVLLEMTKKQLLQSVKSKRFFHSQDIYIFVLTFWSCRKNDLIRNIRLISKFITPQLGQQTSTIDLLHNIS